MRIKQILAFLGAAAVSTVVLAAPAPVSVSADGSTVTVHGDTSPVFHLTPGQAEDTNGAYKLQDGRMLRLTSQSSRVFMEMEGKREELLPLSRTEFVSARSGARVELDADAFAEKITLTQFRNQ
jgi:hypothetical protein